MMCDVFAAATRHAVFNNISPFRAKRRATARDAIFTSDFISSDTYNLDDLNVLSGAKFEYSKSYKIH